MLLYERFQLLLDRKNETIAEVAKSTGIPYTTVDSIIKKKQKSTSAENSIKLAKYFGVTVEWFIAGEEKENRAGYDGASPNKKKVLDQIRDLKPEDEAAVLAFIKSLKEFKKEGD